MASGVMVQDACKTAFSDLKMGKKFKYVLFSLTSDMKEVQVLKTAEPSCDYDDFVADLKAAEEGGECRFALYDAVYTAKKEGVSTQEKQKIFFLFWSPDSAKIKQKMVYASSKDALKRALGEGIGKEIQANDHGDLDWNNVLEQISRMDRN